MNLAWVMRSGRSGFETPAAHQPRLSVGFKDANKTVLLSTQPPLAPVWSRQNYRCAADCLPR